VSTGSAAVTAGRAALRPRTLARAAARLTLPVLMLPPAMVIIVGLVGYPLVRTVYLSFTDTDGQPDLGGRLVSLSNFRCSPTSTCARRS
jgi:ABC-type sugar transport system permease subunit